MTIEAVTGSWTRPKAKVRRAAAAVRGMAWARSAPIKCLAGMVG